MALGLVVACGLASAGAVEVGDAEVDLSVEGGRLSMAFAQAVPLGDLIEAIGAEAGFGVSLTGDLGLVQPRSMDQRPLDEAIRTLTGDHSLLMIYDHGDQHAGPEQIVRIVIRAARPPGEREQARARARARQSAPAAQQASPLADDVAERIRELHEQGTSPGEIAESVDTPVERVRRYLQTLEQ